MAKRQNGEIAVNFKNLDWRRGGDSNFGNQVQKCHRW
jgi:hypothetical protein